MTQETAKSPATDAQSGAMVPVSDETRSLVEQQMPDESDEVKQKFAELVTAIKYRAAQELESAEEVSRDAYVTALEKAQETMARAQGFFREQEQTIESNVNQVKDDATKQWDTLVADIKSMGNRLDRAIEAAWSILTEENPSRPKE